MTYIPKGTKRHWTAEEESLLAESWGVCGIPALAKKLNRSQGAIKLRASRLHLGPLLMGGDYVTLNQLVTAFNRTGSYSYKMISWVENRGLPVHNKRVQQNTFRVVYLKEFWTWAEKNRSFLDFSKLEPLAFGEEPAWVAEQRKRDFKACSLQRKDPWDSRRGCQAADAAGTVQIHLRANVRYAAGALPVPSSGAAQTLG